MATTVAVTLEPEAPLDAAPGVMRVHVRPQDGDAPLDPRAWVLARGEIGSAQLGQLARDEVSVALAERLVPAVTWAEDGGVVLAPSEPLAPGPYAVASGAPRVAVPIVVGEPDLPVLARVWPPAGAAASHTEAVWCGEQPLGELGVPVELAPAQVEGWLLGGVAPAAGLQCLRLSAAAAPPFTVTGPLVPPPLLSHAEPVARLDPRPLTIEAVAPPWEALACAVGEQPFGPGCARVLDDRLLVTAPAQPLLWAITGMGMDRVEVTGESQGSFVVDGLPAQSAIALSVHTRNVAGELQALPFTAFTAPPMPHVVLNEVLANPFGAEPRQEWVELYNDGALSAELEGYVLVDAGETPLPAAVLPPGGFALIVGDDYDELSSADAQPPPGTLLVRVPRVGKNGLSNEGEPLELYDQHGTLVSRFPAEPKPKSGASVMRTEPQAPDNAPESFVRSPEGSSPGTQNPAIAAKGEEIES